MKNDRGLKEDNGVGDINGERKLLSMILHRLLSVLVIGFCMAIFFLAFVLLNHNQCLIFV